MIDGCCSYAGALASGIGELDGAEPTAMPSMNQGLVRFLDPHGSVGG